jgi:hypothetical protein
MRRPFALWPHLVFGSIHPQVWVFLVRSSSRAIRLFVLEDLMIENKIDKAMKPIPVPMRSSRHSRSISRSSLTASLAAPSSF